MAHDTVGQKLAADYDAVAAQIASLKDDLAKMAQTMSDTTTKRGRAAVRDASAGVSDAITYVGRKGRRADLRLEGAVAANPYVALAAAAVIGVLLGTLTRR